MKTRTKLIQLLGVTADKVAALPAPVRPVAPRSTPYASSFSCSSSSSDSESSSISLSSPGLSPTPTRRRRDANAAVELETALAQLEIDTAALEQPSETHCPAVVVDCPQPVEDVEVVQVVAPKKQQTHSVAKRPYPMIRKDSGIGLLDEDYPAGESEEQEKRAAAADDGGVSAVGVA